MNKTLLIDFSRSQKYPNLIEEIIAKLLVPTFSDDETLDRYRTKLLNSKSELFTETKSGTNEQIVLGEHQQLLEKVKNGQVDISQLLPKSNQMDVINSELDIISTDISVLLRQSRIKTAASIQSGIKANNGYTLTDRLGFRIVLDTRDYIKLLNRLVDHFAPKIAFMTNTFTYTMPEIVKNIGKYGRYFRAHNLYLKNENGDTDTEIQLVTPALFAWITLNHDTNYKRIITTSTEMRNEIDTLGLVANYNDYLLFLGD